MAKHIDGPWIIAANRLTDGRAVFLGANGDWVTGAAAAELLESEAERDAALARAERAENGNIVIAPEAIAAEVHAGTPKPVKLRERIRAEGPTIDALEIARRASGGG